MEQSRRNPEHHILHPRTSQSPQRLPPALLQGNQVPARPGLWLQVSGGAAQNKPLADKKPREPGKEHAATGLAGRAKDALACHLPHPLRNFYI